MKRPTASWEILSEGQAILDQLGKLWGLTGSWLSSVAAISEKTGEHFVFLENWGHELRKPCQGPSRARVPGAVKQY